MICKYLVNMSHVLTGLFAVTLSLPTIIIIVILYIKIGFHSSVIAILVIIVLQNKSIIHAATVPSIPSL